MKDATTPLTETQRFNILFANGAFNPATAQPDTAIPPIPGFQLIYSNPSGNQSITQPVGTTLSFAGAIDFTNATVTGLATGGGGGLACNTGATSGLMYWDASSSSCKVDISFQTDGAGNVTGVTLNLSGALTASTVSTTGTGGVLDGQAQVPPSSITLGHYQVFENVNNHLLGCLENPSGTLVSCMPASPIIATGSTVLPATLVSANGGCNLYTTTSTGLTSSNKIIPFVNVDVTGVSGYAPGNLEVYPPYASANAVNFKVCNPTTGNITPASLTIFWTVL